MSKNQAQAPNPITPNTIIDFLADNFGIDPKNITLSSTIESLGLDALDVVEMSFGLEDMLQIDLPEGAIEGWKTVGDIFVSCGAIAPTFPQNIPQHSYKPRGANANTN